MCLNRHIMWEQNQIWYRHAWGLVSALRAPWQSKTTQEHILTSTTWSSAKYSKKYCQSDKVRQECHTRLIGWKRKRKWKLQFSVGSISFLATERFRRGSVLWLTELITECSCLIASATSQWIKSYSHAWRRAIRRVALSKTHFNVNVFDAEAPSRVKLNKNPQSLFCSLLPLAVEYSKRCCESLRIGWFVFLIVVRLSKLIFKCL